MRMVSYYVWIAALTMVAISQISGRKNHFNPAIFQEKIPSEACIRIFTGLGDMGCRSHSTVNFDSSAQYGILFEILAIEDSNKSLNELAIVDTLHLELPLAVICPGYLLQNKIFAESLIAKSDKISGLIIYDEKNIEVLSPDSATPALKHQEASDTLEKEWQPGGSGNLHRSFPFPIYRISFQHAKLLGELAQENNIIGSYTHLSLQYNVLEMNSYMGKRGDGLTSRDCLSWKNIFNERDPQCLPLGGQSIWSSLGPLDNRPKVFAAAAIDSIAEFHELAFGSNDAVASIAAMVIAAEAISRSDQSFLDNLIKQPIFFFAQGDEWGSMGSNRFVDDILDFQCRNPIPSPEVQGANELPACADPIYLSTLFQEIKIENIDSVVAIDQVGLADESEDQSPFFYLHPSSTNELNVSMVESLAVTLGIQLSSDFNDFHSSPLPPTPLSAFLRNPAVGSHIKGFVIAGYDQHFVDNAHHSRFDTPSRISLEKIITAGRILAETVIILAANNSYLDSNTILVGLAPVNETLAREVISCLSFSWDCPLFSEYFRWELQSMRKLNPGFDLNYFSNGINEERERVFDDNMNNFVTSQNPNYYVGPYSSFSKGGGQPIIVKGDQKFSAYSRIPWESSTTFLTANPSKLEAFLRNSMNYYFGKYRQGSPINQVESSFGSCDEIRPCLLNCTILQFSSVGTECIKGLCVCPVAFYHPAVDSGVEPEAIPGLHKVVSDGAYVYSEPYWKSLDVSTLLLSTFHGLLMTLFLFLFLAFMALLSTRKIQQIINHHP